MNFYVNNYKKLEKYKVELILSKEPTSEQLNFVMTKLKKLKLLRNFEFKCEINIKSNKYNPYKNRLVF